MQTAVARPLAALVAGLALAACEPAPAARSAAPASAPASQAFTPTGPAETLDPVADDRTIAAADVVELDRLTHQGDAHTVKLFGTAGGDPAMNGLYVHVAFYESPAEGWRVFRLGDFLDYRVVGDTPGRVDLEIRESVMDQATGDIGSRTRRMVATWAWDREGAPPAVVTLAPAR